MVAMSSTTGASSPAGIATASGLVPSRGLGAAPGRHVVGARDRRVDADHAVRERQRRIDAGGAGMVRAPRADPGDTGRARELDRGLGGARHHQVAHAVVAVDQRGRRRRLVTECRAAD